MASARPARFNVRVGAQDDVLIRKAARVLHKTVTDFVLDSARASAEDVLADRTQFKLNAARWQAFVRALERPARVKPRLRDLLTKPSVVARGDW